MSKWVRTYDRAVFNSEEEACEDAELNVDYSDLVDQVDNGEVSLIEIIKELQKIDSPLFLSLYEEAVEQHFKDFYCAKDEEEEEEDSFPGGYPYTETKPKAFY